VMEGFLNIRLRPWLRRLITRLLAIVPAIIVIMIYGEQGSEPLLVLSQVILSLQLPFAIFPLVRFTSDPRFMGPFTNKPWINALAWPVVILIAALNVYLLYQTGISFFGS
jgi:manganese transport protein